MSCDICPFYLYESTGWISSRQTCKVTNAEINSTTYKNYCDGYYERCPNYKPADSGNSGGCYLTSACVEAMGRCDNCFELTTLRAFRDHWLSQQDGGREEIKEYYHIAPAIVDKIHASDDCRQVLTNLYFRLVMPCVEMIKAGKNEEAHCLYREITNELKRKYL